MFKLRRTLTKGRANRPGEPQPSDQIKASSLSRRLGGDASPYLKQLQANAAEFAQALKAGRTAARAMWARTRDPQVHGQNEVILEADARRLAVWREWLKKALRTPTVVMEATPVCGIWQLQFMVHNFAPAVQKVSIEQQDSDGTWRVLASRHTIEFRAQAARPASKLKREFTVPVDSATAKLRVTVGGVGQVAISHVKVTNGVESRAMRPLGRKKVLGRRAPQRGLPDPGAPAQAGLLIACNR